MFDPPALRTGLVSHLCAPDAPDAPGAADEPSGEESVDPMEAEVDEEDTEEVPRLMTCLELFGKDLELQDPCRSSTICLHSSNQA